MKFDTIDEAIASLKAGNMVIVLDNEDRENEGDLLAVTEYMKDDTINFMAKNGRGLICTPISRKIAESLHLNPMVQNNRDVYGTNFTASIDHKSTTTGISAHERTLTARALIDDASEAVDFHQPGHLFPLIAKDRGVIEREGHTEACVDLARLSGAKPAGVICEIMNEDGTMAKGEDLQKFKETHQLKMITITDLIKYRKKYDALIQEEAKVKMPTKFGEFEMYGFTSIIDNQEHVVISKGDLREVENVRIHSSCVTGDIFHSERCDCGDQLEAAMSYINEHGGAIIYLSQEGRGIGLMNKLKAYKLIEEGHDTVSANEALGFEADLREYGVAAQILRHLGIKSVNLLSNNPDKFTGLEAYDININSRIELVTKHNEHNHEYLITKKEKMGHLI
ncbi:bifunctional 3,4-dihydroxy-2-butanone-4-phosphate synthase/GTP cyclohydrolase II [Staphylococcus massiliensis]|uniref:Riboflavin biosynthesis protein RibBA n=1 Tax=Staphylococcus massiliensis S46 TaxID=1229783 RepID=K9AW18_9STAP|nr:bifunctional 3,4-dihydroxy-2-butanone-4-phosphate synthase/GTP cyclohydrolase II [Staphylococcus massiliensis]EKU50281.1 riboflavin biosynthesis protein [Staphylococcus massiliensis S46]MCG3399693.1 bifunctional 3,4-dihydroxy-2-butanone-4-phosphate synthase/GTP cyclohydrolase II [Staphylococcus massiliensis]MCG3400798.1 bifunctional 3,4-dihydroxy-2-butanone-4-phosphate synthase/GTP cyclohydrolase II [Staphylococcus massiliensis]MCG3412038.1 bifunctional 3,4-dihydroxy-2-butanone-4-phosphate s